MADKTYKDFATADYDPAKILLQADPVTGALTKLLNSSFNLIKSATVTLTDAEIKALPSTAFEILPAPGVNKLLWVLSGILKFSLVSAYTNRHADNAIFLTYDEWFAEASALTTLPNGTADDFSSLIPAAFVESRVAWDSYLRSGIDSQPSSDCVNRNIKLFCDNAGSGDFTGGNAANTLKVTIYY